MKRAAVYIMANSRKGTLYTGVTGDLVRRVYQHKTRVMAGFTSKYDCTCLVYYEAYDELPAAIAREKQIKAGSRKKKLELIESMTPEWRDLYKHVI
jgi:putative endonuclease